jgi:hypothetical protein
VVAVADFQPPAILIPLRGKSRDVLLDLSLQRLGQHPPGTLPDDLIDQRRLTSALAAGRIRDYG